MLCCDCRRRQFGPSNEPEHLLMDYQTHQLRLMPRLATCLGLIFAVRSVNFHCAAQHFSEMFLYTCTHCVYMSGVNTFVALLSSKPWRTLIGSWEFSTCNRVSKMLLEAFSFFTHITAMGRQAMFFDVPPMFVNGVTENHTEHSEHHFQKDTRHLSLDAHVYPGLYPVTGMMP